MTERGGCFVSGYLGSGEATAAPWGMQLFSLDRFRTASKAKLLFGFDSRSKDRSQLTPNSNNKHVCSRSLSEH